MERTVRERDRNTREEIPRADRQRRVLARVLARWMPPVLSAGSDSPPADARRPLRKKPVSGNAGIPSARERKAVPAALRAEIDTRSLAVLDFRPPHPDLAIAGGVSASVRPSVSRR